MFAWFRKIRAWRREHERAWASVREPDATGVSPFQRACLESLSSVCQRTGQPAPQVERSGQKETYFTGALADGRSFFIYLDGAEVGDKRLEEWDYLTPEELRAAFSNAVATPNRDSLAV